MSARSNATIIGLGMLLVSAMLVSCGSDKPEPVGEQATLPTPRPTPGPDPDPDPDPVPDPDPDPVPDPDPDPVTGARTYMICDAANISRDALIAFFDAREGDTIEFCAGRFDMPTGLIVNGKRGITIKALA